MALIGNINPIVLGITSRSDVLSLEEVQALLLAHESHLDHHSTMIDLSLKMQENLVFVSSRNVCLKIGHIAAIYHYRFDKNWVTSKPRPPPQAYLVEQEFEYDPHVCSITVLPHFSDDGTWHADTWATNYVTYGIENLDSATPTQTKKLFVTVNSPVIRKRKYWVSCTIPHRLGKVKWDDSETV
uniref:Uncharacterized protein n=1 Tax=Cannabis sativa TaxID=3483 RepID=A0A803PEB5_CANSA